MINLTEINASQITVQWTFTPLQIKSVINRIDRVTYVIKAAIVHIYGLSV